MSILDGVDFSGEFRGKSAYDLLKGEIKNVRNETMGRLDMQIESFNVYEDKNTTIKHIVYILTPNMGNYRRKLFTIFEQNQDKPFPVRIVCENTLKTIFDVEEENFLEEVNKLLRTPSQTRTIQELFKFSEPKNNK
jgi:hypothetical protein